MKPIVTALKVFVAGLILVAGGGCSSTDGGGVHVDSAVYYGAGFDDSWYYGGIDYPPDVIVTPPERPVDPPKPTHPIVLPPTSPAPHPMPSIPSTPRPAFRR
ncbi:MAG TPA: hypothetical protein VNM37_21070 [Candidatus Dormibacteraeota bacterium]|jgi:hypothetical protein|nr:hypothetical protein [Verrucomicrobiae bacterium]HXJ75360.1 hypothetical protein [Candidatus Dormibacteraeota bacterium]